MSMRRKERNKNEKKFVAKVIVQCSIESKELKCSVVIKGAVRPKRKEKIERVKFILAHKKSMTMHYRIMTPANTAPAKPTNNVAHTPASGKRDGTGDPLSNGKYDGVGVEWMPPVPPPVRFAPFGPMGRESSVKAQELSLHKHCPLIGSQNGVAQSAGKRERKG